MQLKRHQGVVSNSTCAMPDTLSIDAIGDTAAEWFVRLRDEDASADDQRQFAAWLSADPRHADAWAEIEQLWTGLDDVGPAPAEPARAQASIAANKQRQWRHKLILAAAACVPFMAIGLAWLTLPASAFAPFADYRTSVGEQRELSLPDGSIVTLDADSALSLNFTANERNVTLETGRAFFQVARDAEWPFTVTTGSGRVRAIGTAFDVNTAGANTVVAVSEGHVRVTLNDGGAADLRRGDSLRFGKALGAVHRVAPTDVAAWREHRLVFQDAPLAEVLADLQRYRGGRILIPDRQMSERPVTGVFDIRNPDEALATICRLLPVRSIEPSDGLTILLPVEPP